MGPAELDDRELWYIDLLCSDLFFLLDACFLPFLSSFFLLLPSWLILAPSWTILAPSWAILAPSWAILAPQSPPKLPQTIPRLSPEARRGPQSKKVNKRQTRPRTVEPIWDENIE